MVAEVYADLYFLINTCMDLLCLMITGMLLHRRTGRVLAILGATLGGLYAVLALLFSPGGILGVLLDVAVAFGMCAIAFGGRGTTFVGILKCTAVQFLTSMLLGGIMTVLYTLLNRMQLPLDALEGDGLSVWTFALLSAVAGIMTAHGGRFFGISKKTRSVTVRATILGSEITLRALVDSGNLLRDPVSGRYVIVSDREKLAAALPREARDLLLSPLSVPTAPQGNALRLRLIPATTASGQALLPAFLPDNLSVSDGRGSYRADYLIAAAELGDSARGFDAVIPLE